VVSDASCHLPVGCQFRFSCLGVVGSLAIDIDGYFSAFSIIGAYKVMPFFAFDDWTRIDVKYFS